jgi:hypothetical protein
MNIVKLFLRTLGCWPVLTPSSLNGIWQSPNLKARPNIVHFCTFALEQIPHCSVVGLGLATMRDKPVLGHQYLVRQATTLLKFAKSVRDPNVSAALVEKAAYLRDRADETMPPIDPNPQAPDVEPP